MYIDWEQRNKSFLFADDMILYVENLTELMKILLELILVNNFSKVSEFKVNIQVSITFPYTSNKI